LGPNEPLSLHKSWLLHQPRRRFELGSLLDPGGPDLTEFAVQKVLGQSRSGWWECRLVDDSLTWTSGVYDIFGFPQLARVGRDEAVAVYREESRAAMERLREYAIAHRRGFVLDAQIRPAGGQPERWMRLITEPVVEGGQVVLLHGLKLLI
jgi:hypothetical protein